jgi:hypothetical protein
LAVCTTALRPVDPGGVAAELGEVGLDIGDRGIAKELLKGRL